MATKNKSFVDEAGQRAVVDLAEKVRGVTLAPASYRRRVEEVRRDKEEKTYFNLGELQRLRDMALSGKPIYSFSISPDIIEAAAKLTNEGPKVSDRQLGMANEIFVDALRLHEPRRADELAKELRRMVDVRAGKRAA